MRRATLSTMMVFAVALLVPAASASATGAPPRVRREARDVRDAKRELRDDVRDRREAVREGDRREVRQETREIHRDRRDVRQETRQLHRVVVRHRVGR